MKTLSEEHKKNFLNMIFQLSVVESGQIDRTYFYEKFCDYIESHGLLDDDTSLDEYDSEEQSLFREASERGYLGLVVVKTIDKENIKTFIENLTSKNLSTTFLFSVYNEEDEKLSLTEFYYKWNGEPPEGWLANYCKCGSFDPQTPDLGELKNPNLHYKLPELYRPTNIFIEEIWKIEIMSNNMLRFVMDDYYTYNCMILQQLKTNQL